MTTLARIENEMETDDSGKTTHRWLIEVDAEHYHALTELQQALFEEGMGHISEALRSLAAIPGRVQS